MESEVRYVDDGFLAFNSNYQLLLFDFHNEISTLQVPRDFETDV
jgi:hypothetical protein